MKGTQLRTFGADSSHGGRSSAAVNWFRGSMRKYSFGRMLSLQEGIGDEDEDDRTPALSTSQRLGITHISGEIFNDSHFVSTRCGFVRASLRDAFEIWVSHHGLKPMATSMLPLRGARRPCPIRGTPALLSSIRGRTDTEPSKMRVTTSPVCGERASANSIKPACFGREVPHHSTLAC
jgi:hypothetical protein